MAFSDGRLFDGEESYSEVWKAIFQARLERLFADRDERAQDASPALADAPFWREGGGGFAFAGGARVTPAGELDDHRAAFLARSGGDAPRFETTPETIAPGGAPIEGSRLAFFVADISGGAGEQRIIAELTDGAVIDPALLEGAEVTFFAASVDGAADIGSVRLLYEAFENGRRTDARFKVENFEPFALFGDADGDFLRGLTLDEGEFSLRYEVFSEDFGRGRLIESETISFTVAETPTPAPDPAPAPGEHNAPPVAIDDFGALMQGEALRIDVVANDLDADGDTITVTRILSASDGIAAVVDEGDVVISAAGWFSGDGVVSYEVSDGRGGVDIGRISVTVAAPPAPPNQAPVARDDAATLGHDESGDIDVLANDSDPDGDALTLSRIVSSTDGVAATIREGLLAIEPDPGFVGEALIRYEASDGNGGRSEADLTVTVDPPPEPAGPRLSFFLVDIRGGVGEQRVLAELSDGAVIEADLVDDVPVTIFATSEATDIGSVRLNYVEREDGVVVETINRVENFDPYTLFGDDAGDFTRALSGFGEGEFTIEYDVLSGANGRGAVLESDAFDFTVVDTTPEPETDPQPDPEDGGGENGDPFQNGVIESYVSGGPAASSFNIETVFTGSGWTVDFQRAFVTATEFLSDVIIGDTQDTPAGFGRGAVDDIRIEVTLGDIDGRGGTLAFAGPRRIGPEGLSATGASTFDVGDIGALASRSTLDDVVVHEFFHALGSGTLFRRKGLFDDEDDRFTGELATLLYNQEFPAIAAEDPGSNRGVPLTADGGHLSEEIFTNELNTPSLGGRSVLSQTSVAILEDLGYDTYLDNPFDDDDLFGPRPLNPVTDDLIA